VNVGGTRVRWGLGNFLWLWLPFGFVGLLAAIGSSGNDSNSSVSVAGLIISAAIQYGIWIGGLVWISRARGRGSLELDFGLKIRPDRAWVLLVGAGLQLALGALVLPLVHLANNEMQQVVDDLKTAGGASLVVLVVIAGVLAPVVEELLFRGLLLRSLRRRFSVEVAIVLSALIFALTHLFGDASLGVVAIVPALFALGVISGVAAVWSGDLSISIFLHMGFNLLTLIAAIASR
jgi:membrane protease YdiL (CAAX protease family)